MEQTIIINLGKIDIHKVVYSFLRKFMDNIRLEEEDVSVQNKNSKRLFAIKVKIPKDYDPLPILKHIRSIESKELDSFYRFISATDTKYSYMHILSSADVILKMMECTTFADFIIRRMQVIYDNKTGVINALYTNNEIPVEEDTNFSTVLPYGIKKAKVLSDKIKEFSDSLDEEMMYDLNSSGARLLQMYMYNDTHDMESISNIVRALTRQLLI